VARLFLHGSETSVLLELTGLAERRWSLEEGLCSVFPNLNASSENNHEDDLVAVTTIFWVSMMNKLCYGC
jgi:hypothetical protein